MKDFEEKSKNIFGEKIHKEYVMKIYILENELPKKFKMI